ncbi:MAG TPA: roadblock/LC7 domain-containing protein [Planctomycetota bacterium]|nr:roadblock/LC7 domain-containing protein [Planctomycetota bacterium]
MRDILTNLNKAQGVWGSMLVGRDGIVIASDFSTDVQEQQMGAISSQILVALDGALKRIQMGGFKRFLIGGSENKLALIDAGQSILIVLMRRDVNMGLVNVEIKNALDLVAKGSRISG